MLEVQQLAVNYRDICGLDRVSFWMERGQLVGVIGPNGAGKVNNFMQIMSIC